MRRRIDPHRVFTVLFVSDQHANGLTLLWLFRKAEYSRSGGSDNGPSVAGPISGVNRLSGMVKRYHRNRQRPKRIGKKLLRLPGIQSIGRRLTHAHYTGNRSRPERRPRRLSGAEMLQSRDGVAKL